MVHKLLSQMDPPQKSPLSITGLMMKQKFSTLLESYQLQSHFFMRFSD